MTLRSRTSAALILTLTFGMGCITGGVSYYLYQNRVALGDTRTGTQSSSRDTTAILGKYLSLDTAQKEELKIIIAKSKDRYRALSQQFSPQYDVVRNETRQQIRNILRPEQMDKFEEFLKDTDRRHKEREARRN